MLTIYINNNLVSLGSPLPSEITSLSITIQPSPFPLQVPSDQVPHIKAWLNSLLTRLKCDYITYQGNLVPVSDLKPF